MTEIQRLSNFAINHANKLTECGYKWTEVTLLPNPSNEIKMSCGRINLRGEHERANVTFKYYLDNRDRVTYVTYPHP